MTTLAYEKPILPGQTWQDRRGKHLGRKVEILKYNGLTVMAKYLRGIGRSWDSKDVGKVITVGADAFRQNYEPVHSSGGGSVHDAPLPPAAVRGEIRREEMPITVTQTIEKVLASNNGITNPPVVAETPEPVKQAICTKCGTTRPVTEFYTNKASGSGHHTWCKVCMRAAVKAYSDRKRAEKHGAPVVNTNERKFAELTDEQKSEIKGLRDKGQKPQEICHAYGISGVVYGMVIKEHDKKTQKFALDIFDAADASRREMEKVMEQGGPTWQPVTPKSAVRAYQITYVPAQKTVTMTLHGESIGEALADAMGRDYVQEVIEIKAL